MADTLAQFFARVTGSQILPYQERYGLEPFVHTLMAVPTGLGKTWAVCVPWLYGVQFDEQATPTRQILVLPRQNLTEQTYSAVRALVEKAGLSNRVRVLELMGGSSDNNDITLRPDDRAIIVCTQDMYLSRALNRGYARRPPRWPIDFALFNNDCHIVFDELQLMGDGLATSTQLAAFRERFSAVGKVPCTWMSATVAERWLDTVDFKAIRPRIRVVQLDASDHASKIVQTRVRAAKTIAAAPAGCRMPRGCAEFVLAQHEQGTRTLVVANTVTRAREIFEDLKALGGPAALIHSRFRAGDRNRKLAECLTLPPEGQIVVSTQVLEAGVNISSRLMLTDLAPWSSMVQRFGRVNRYGEQPSARIYWVDEPQSTRTLKSKNSDSVFTPYNEVDVERSAERLKALTSASPLDLAADDSPEPWRYVLRQADLIDLFDTSPDLAGNDIDVSRFIRSGDERDCYVAWREFDREAGPLGQYEVRDDELCPVPIGELREFLGKRRRAWAWDFAGEEWRAADPDRLCPGMILLLPSADGGYTPEGGWSPASTAPTPALVSAVCEPEGDSSDPASFTRESQTLSAHTALVQAEMRRLIGCGRLAELEIYRADLEAAALKHDWGKAHRVMQETLSGNENGGALLAKSATTKKHSVPNFRHELGSALAMLQAGDSDLAAYLAGAHHGRIRMSIRSMPGEKEGRVRGLKEGDTLSSGELAPSFAVGESKISLEPMRLGCSSAGELSWMDRAIRLRDGLGPFRLAYLEMLLRAADARASERQTDVASCAH